MTRKENAMIALQGGTPESVPCFFNDYELMFVTPMGERPPLGELEGNDIYGVHLTATSSAGGAFTPTPTVPPVLTDITEWKTQVNFPDYTSIDWEKAYQEDERIWQWDRENKVQDMFYANGLFERMHYLMGFEEALCSFYEEPEAAAELIEAIADTKITFIKNVLKVYKPDVFTFLDDYAHQSGLFMSIDMFREFFKPHLKRIVDAVHEEDTLFKIHCCGNMESLTQEYIDIGVDAIDPVQPMNDIVAMKKLLDGKIGIVGGLDVQNVIDNSEATGDDARREVRRCIDTYAPGGGYTLYCASVNLRNPEALKPDGTLGALKDEAEKYGKDWYLKNP